MEIKMIMMTAEESFTEIRRLGETLMNHQCWFFGRDIWHSSGNLLVRYGFERFGVPKNQKGGNSYRLTLDERSELVIWGFGIFLGDDESGGIFLGRFDFSPKILKQSRLDLPISNREQIPAKRRPRSGEERRTALRMIRRIVDWITGYEFWIEKTCGEGWRKECLADWEKAVLGADEIASGWKILQRKLKQI